MVPVSFHAVCLRLSLHPPIFCRNTEILYRTTEFLRSLPEYPGLLLSTIETADDTKEIGVISLHLDGKTPVNVAIITRSRCFLNNGSAEPFFPRPPQKEYPMGNWMGLAWSASPTRTDDEITCGTLAFIPFFSSTGESLSGRTLFPLSPTEA